MLTSEQARAIADQALAAATADETSLSLRGGTTAHLRFARNTPTTSGSADDTQLTVRSVFGSRTGSFTVNQLDAASLRDAVARAEALAKLAPQDPEHMPALGPQTYPSPPSYDAATAERGAEAMAGGVATCLGQARDAGLVAAGFADTRAGFSCLATSTGGFGYHRTTGASISETARTPDGTGSGWATQASHRMADVDYGAVSRVALAKAAASRAPRPLAPGTYPTILEPACVANLIQMLLWSMDARRASEGRSFFSASEGGTRVGERLFPEPITIASDPADPRAPGAPWAQDGRPQAPQTWIERGVLRTLHTSRYWAAKEKLDPVPPPSNVLMAGGKGGVDELIAGTERGVLVTSLWYIRPVDPRTLLFTGLTRDGVFWIENGEIAHPVQNFRWNDSPVSVLRNAVAMSAPVRTSPRSWGATNLLVPAIKTSAFTFSSVSEAV